MLSGPRGKVGADVLEIVIGDVHARRAMLAGLLQELGVIGDDGRRRERAWIVQLGDLLDKHADPEDNLETARLAASTVDVVLAGNHEAELLDGGAHGPALAMLATRGWPHAAHALGDWLITHAGVHPGLASGLPAAAGECAAEINDRWHRRARDPLFDWVGPERGGRDPHGGLFRLQAGEWPRGVVSPWPQISGHVPQDEPRQLGPRRWAIDVGGRGGRLAALVRARRDAPWRPVVAQVRRRRRALAAAA